MFVTGAILAGVSWSEVQASNSPVSGKVSVYAVVPAPRPSTAPVITTPANGQSFSANPITMSGACPRGAFVKVFTNGVMAGSTTCSANGQFTLQIDLVVGQNALTATAFNIDDESGPTSNAINVTLTAPSGGLGFSQELLLQSANYYRGAAPGVAIVWPITLLGGVSPYAVGIDWGDGKHDLLTRTAPGPFSLTHTYAGPGGYLGTWPLIIRATDAAGHSAYLQVTSIVNAPNGTVSTATAGTQPLNRLLIMWPIWILMILVVVAFWLGEWRERLKLKRRIEALA